MATARALPFFFFFTVAIKKNTCFIKIQQCTHHVIQPYKACYLVVLSIFTFVQS